jgi:threonine dehydrogenase-like Zn-dependent dehydrogenase
MLKQQTALVEPLSVAWRAVHCSGIQPGQSALIVGGGPIGLAILLCLRAAGITTIVVTEMAARRKELASECGASLVLDPSKEQDVLGKCKSASAGGDGMDVAFDCAGVQAGLELAVEAVRPKGKIVNVAVWEDMPRLPMNALLFKEKTLVGTLRLC